jgi:hypothetical protein
MKRLLVVLVVSLILSGTALAGPEDATVRLSSHGGSGVCIQTGPNYSYILSCAHCFTGYEQHCVGMDRFGQPVMVEDKSKPMRAKPIVVEVRSPDLGPTRRVGVKLVQIDETADLALLLVNVQLPYVCPVPPAGFSPTVCSTAGYDEMKGLVVRKATILRNGPNWTITKEPPWHGRSGGGLIDARGYVVGVVHAYDHQGNQPPHSAEEVKGVGIHVSHASIVRFLATFKGTTQIQPAPQQPPQVYEQRTPLAPQAFPPQQQFQFRQPQIYEQRSQGFALPCPT